MGESKPRAQKTSAVTGWRLIGLRSSISSWVGLSVNPHPLKAKGAAPNGIATHYILRTLGAACCAPTQRGCGDRLEVEVEGVGVGWAWFEVEVVDEAGFAEVGGEEDVDGAGYANY